jgi:hypothetical protein
MFLGLPLPIRVSWVSRFALAGLGFALTFYFHFHVKAKKFDWMIRRVGKPYKGVPHCHRVRFVFPPVRRYGNVRLYRAATTGVLASDLQASHIDHEPLFQLNR